MALQLKRWLALFSGLALLVLAVSPVYALPAIPLLAAKNVQAGEVWECVEVNGQSNLNVRNGPGVSYAVVSSRTPGEQVQADYSRIENADGYQWVPVRFLGGQGWSITPRLSSCEDNTPANESGPNVADQNNILNREEIATIARSVVSIATLQHDHIVAFGTGTITSSDGIIITNAHVLEDAEDIAVGFLDNINEPPEYRYLGEIISLNEELDVALIAIRYDLDGNPVQTTTLDLPYIPISLSANDVYRGDSVHIFGYPGIGGDFLVVTTGSIVSVENGMIDGQRLPIWYRTDAEIAPGNSGGLAVNSKGEFLGIPTVVATEYQTGGRLGGIRPVEVALMAVEDNPYVADDADSSVRLIPVDVMLHDLSIEHMVVEEGLLGMMFHLAFTLTDWEQRTVTAYARFYHDDIFSVPLVNATAPTQYRDADNAVLTSATLQVCCDVPYDDVQLFIPYQALGLLQTGTHPLMVQIEIVGEGESWQYTLSWEFLTYTRE